MKSSVPFLGFFVLLAACGLAAAPVRADALADGAKTKVQPVVKMGAHAFALRDVQLLDGPFKHAMELDEKYLLSLEPDRLLHTFRLNAGLPSTAQPLGGWEAPSGELRGHFVGHYLSACALMYASTGDAQFKAKGDAVVAGMAECQAKIGSGYLSAYPETFFDRVEARQRVWAPYYTMHKIYAGLLDMYEYCDSQQALDVCKKFGDWVIARNGRLSDDQMQNMLGEEHGGMNETLANLYAVTGDEKYIKIAQRFNHNSVIAPASRREDRLNGLHANTQVPKFIGTAREYELLGTDWLKTASTFFWDNVVHDRSYVIGGNSSREQFTPKAQLSQSVEPAGAAPGRGQAPGRAQGTNTCETCNTYNMLKLTRHLFCIDPKAEFADYYERALYNHILASQNPQTGMMCYFVPLQSGASKQSQYSTPLNTFACCTGTGVENHAKHGDSIYFYDDAGLYLNLFIASELNWKARGVKVRQETRYPDKSASKLTFTCDKPQEFALRVRRPFWAEKGFQISVNGKSEEAAAAPGNYVELKRTWKTGDTVEIALPFNLRTEGFKDNPNRFAFLNGPIVLCAEVGDMQTFPQVVVEQQQTLSALAPVAGKPNTFTSDDKTFRVPGAASGAAVTLEPLYKMHDNRRYKVYWDRQIPTVNADAK